MRCCSCLLLVERGGHEVGGVVTEAMFMLLGRTELFSVLLFNWLCISQRSGFVYFGDRKVVTRRVGWRAKQVQDHVAKALKVACSSGLM